MKKIINWFKSLFAKEDKVKEEEVLQSGVGGRPDDRKGGD